MEEVVILEMTNMQYGFIEFVTKKGPLKIPHLSVCVG
jgi:hypothetical protein